MMSLWWTGLLLIYINVFSGCDELVVEKSAPGFGRNPSKIIWIKRKRKHLSYIFIIYISLFRINVAVQPDGDVCEVGQQGERFDSLEFWQVTIVNSNTGQSNARNVFLFYSSQMNDITVKAVDSVKEFFHFLAHRLIILYQDSNIVLTYRNSVSLVIPTLVSAPRLKPW